MGSWYQAWLSSLASLIEKVGDNLPLTYPQPWGSSIHFILSLIFFAGSWRNKNIQVLNMLLLMKLIFSLVWGFFGQDFREYCKGLS